MKKLMHIMSSDRSSDVVADVYNMFLDNKNIKKIRMIDESNYAIIIFKRKRRLKGDMK